MLAPTPATLPTAPLLQLAMVTTAGPTSRVAAALALPLVVRPVVRQVVRSALARRSPLTRSAAPSGSSARCSIRPKRVS